MGLKFHLTLLVLGFTAVIRTKVTALDGKQDDIYQQELAGAEYTSNKLDEPSQKEQFPFYYNNNFDCTKHQYAYGMYADMDFQCQVYHVCHNNRKETFLCPQGTLFNQQLLVCDHWHLVNCLDTPSFYYANNELGKVSNKTRFDSRDGPYLHRRFPDDYGQHSPYLPSHTTVRQGQQFPYSHDKSTQFPFPQSTTEAPIDSYRTRDQASYPSRSQSGRYYPQAPRDQTTNYGQPQVRPQFGQQDRQAPGYGYQSSRTNVQGPQYDNRQQNNYNQQKPETGSRGSLYGDQQSRFNQPSSGVPGTQQNRGLIFNHYSQSRAQRTNQDRKVNNTWPVDQRNSTQAFQYGRQPQQPSWRYGQNYPENALLGSRYNDQKPSTSQFGQHLPEKMTPGSLYGHQPAVSQDGRLHSQVLTSGLTHDSEHPSISLRGQASPFGRSPGSLYSHGRTTGLESGQKRPEFGTPGFLPGRHDPAVTQYGQQSPQSGSSGSPDRSHHPFTTHDGQIHSQVRISNSTYGSQHPSQSGQQQPHIQIPGHGGQQPPFTSQYGLQQPQIGVTGSLYGKQTSTLRDRQQFNGLTSGRQHQSVAQYRQNQSHITTSSPLYRQQQPIITDRRPGYPHPLTGQSVGAYGHQQPSTTLVGHGPQYKSHADAKINRTQPYNQQNPATRLHVYQPQIPENAQRKPEFGYARQSLNRQPDDKPGSGHGVEQNSTSDYEDKNLGSQYDRHNRPAVSYDRESKAFQNPPWQQSGNPQRNQPFGQQPSIVQSQFNSQEHRDQRSQYGRQEPANTQGYKYSWQKPGSPQYSFQQPQYQNMYSSRNPAGPSPLTPNLLNDSSVFSGPSDRSNILGRSHLTNGESWHLRGNNTGNVPVETRFGGGEVAASKGSQDKNLKPILVYQHHIPVTINGNNTRGSNNRTEKNPHQEVPVYKVYYVKGDQKEAAAN